MITKREMYAKQNGNAPVSFFRNAKSSSHPSTVTAVAFKDSALKRDTESERQTKQTKPIRNTMTSIMQDATTKY